MFEPTMPESTMLDPILPEPTVGVESMPSPTLSAIHIADLLGRPRPTPDQIKVIEAPLESMLVIAGAGSGKTETMSARVVWLIANGMVEPNEVLGLTFTRKAAAELGERVRLRLAQLSRAQEQRPQHEGDGSHKGGSPSERAAGQGSAARVLDALDRPTISTYNSYAASLVSDHGLRIGREPGARMLSEATQWALAAEIVERWSADIDSESAVSTIIESVLKLSGSLNEHLLSVPDAKLQLEHLVEPLVEIPVAGRSLKADVGKLGNSLSVRIQLLDLVAEYQHRKRAMESMDFGDQVALAAELALTAPAVGELERERFKVVLLDEYQDTSYAQIKLLTALFGAGHPVTAVGDPNQSIYGWRGASAAGPARFPQQFRNRDGSKATVFQLGMSWRNDTQILAAANYTAHPLYENDPENSLPSLEPRPGAGTGAVSAGYFATIEDEAENAAKFLQEHWQPGVTSAAILCRARSQFPFLEAALRAKGIAVEVVGLGGLLMTPEVVDLVALLEVVHDPSRGDSLMRLLTGPRFYLGPADLNVLGNYARHMARRRPTKTTYDLMGQEVTPAEDPVVEADTSDERSIIDALTHLPPAAWTDHGGRGFTALGHSRLERLARMLTTLRSLTYLPLADLVEQAERVLGLDIEMALIADRSARAGTPRDPANPWGRAHLDAFRKVASEFFDSATTPTLGAFLAWLDDAQKRERGLEKPLGTPDPHAVQLITVHASKGLEWDVVVVPGMVDGVFPSTATGSEKGPMDSGWLTDLGELPFPLRGDARDLPQLDYSAAENDGQVLELMTEFRRTCGAHMVLEERRLAYVAFTRARSRLLISGAWWREAKKPTQPSPFLQELVENRIITDVVVAPAPEPGDENPRIGEDETGVWPPDLSQAVVDPNQSQAVAQAAAHALTRQTIARSAAQVQEVLADLRNPQGNQETDFTESKESKLHEHVDGRIPKEALPSGITSAAGTDLSQLARLLLTERDRTQEVRTEVDFPEHISVSGLVEISRNRETYALDRRRPIPAKPSVASRRGTTFHLWVEQFFGRTVLFDIDDLPGTDDFFIESDEALTAMQTRFERSQWATLVPIELEADIDVVIAGTVIRSRIDGVFPDPDARVGLDGVQPVVVVDWKTGRAPTDPIEKANRELQLAVYRLAWSQWSGTPLDKVSAAFYYVTSDTTVRPQHLATAQEIEDLILGHA
ncbi:ATP-dependent DNA helicase [Jonesiaceae bacterium BS-20]|uniref:DNA 3'-5' helicase n=1 Tax=Jonesiaceae bacterium BS-20 TaxID=3120821 RepID=A0AAU7DYT6_9MICO